MEYYYKNDTKNETYSKSELIFFIYIFNNYIIFKRVPSTKFRLYLYNLYNSQTFSHLMIICTYLNLFLLFFYYHRQPSSLEGFLGIVKIL